MNRFMPDTLRDAILRPLGMAAPNAWVYVEIIAPDVRFALIVILAALAALMSVRKGWRSAPTWSLFGFVTAWFGVWLYTSGNGRYFMPGILVAGPLALALIYHLPFTKAFRFALAMIAIGLQGMALNENSPWKAWDSWELVAWKKAPYFHVDIDPANLDQNATYITVSSITFSLLAPLFPETSRWMNIAAQAGVDPASPQGLRTQKFLTEARSLKVLLPSVPKEMDSAMQPTQVAVQAINESLAPSKLALKIPVKCGWLRSASLTDMSLVKADETKEDTSRQLAKVGFWVCDLNYPVQPPPAPEADARAPQAELVLHKIESLCPRFFAPGQTGLSRMSHGFRRHYPGADIVAYAMDDGGVYYKYDRALNPVLMGQAEDVLKGTVNCNSIRGRTGLPWEREI